MYKFKYPRGHLKLEPLTMAAATMIAGGLSAGSSIASTISGANMNRKNRQWSAEQNQLNRDFQAQEAMKAREWQEDFYNTHQSPSAQIKQYQDAGLNPALMYGNGFTPGSTPSGATPSGGSSISPNTENPLINIDIGKSLLDAFRIKAEIDNINADTNLKNSEAFGKGVENKYAEQIILNQLQQGKAGVKNLNAATDKLIAETANEEEKKGLIAFQKVLSRSQNLEHKSSAALKGEQALYEQWKNTFIKENKYEPGSGLWSSVTTLVGSASQEGGLKGLGIIDLINFLMGNKSDKNQKK